MHANAALLRRLFDALDRHDHDTMAGCYQPDAAFRDIAFDLRGRPQIHAMWHMICGTDIRATFQVVQADDHDGCVQLVDHYTFTDTRRKVRNVIESRLRFRGGLIVEHSDVCDPRAWAAMALGGARGFLAGRIRLLRSRTAHHKLEQFVNAHPEYQ